MQLSDWMNRLWGRLGKIQAVPSGYRFRCPYCGDSQKSQLKARGHVVEKWGKRFFKCHNCGLSKLFDQFLKDVDAELYAEYVNQECPERHLGDAAVPLQGVDSVKLSGMQYLLRGGCSDHHSWRRSKRPVPAHLYRGEKKRFQKCQQTFIIEEEMLQSCIDRICPLRIQVF